MKNCGIERTVIRSRRVRKAERARRRAEEEWRKSGFAFQSPSNVTERVKKATEQIKICRLSEADILTAINILNPGRWGKVLAAVTGPGPRAGLDINFPPDRRHSYRSGESRERPDAPLRICEHRPLNDALPYALKTLQGLIVSAKHTPYCKTSDCNEIRRRPPSFRRGAIERTIAAISHLRFTRLASSKSHISQR